MMISTSKQFPSFLLHTFGFLVFILWAPVVMADTVTWNVDAGGLWEEGSNWDSGLPPGPGDDVLIDRAAGLYTVTIATGNHFAASVTCAENLSITGGSLTVTTTIQVDGAFTQTGGSLIDATLLSELMCSGASCSFDGVTVGGDLVVGGVANTILTVNGGLTLNSKAYVGWGAGYGRLYFNGPQTVDGTGEVIFSDNGSNSIYSQSGAVTIGPGILVHGFRGRLQGSVGFVNQGVIRSDESGGLITLEGTGWRNEGVIEAVQDGTLSLAGQVATSDLGEWHGADGVVELNGLLDNTGDVLALDGETGSLVLAMGTILGGTVAPGADGARVIYQGTAGKLDGVTMEADMVIGDINNTYVNLLNGFTLNGTAYVGWGSNFGRLSFNGPQTMDGTGEVIFSDNGSNSIYSQSGAVTIGPGILVHGFRGRLQGSVGFVNQGVIRSDESGGLITLEGTGWRNEGVLEVTMGGGLSLAGQVATSDLGELHGADGVVELNGLLDNTGDVLALDGETGSLVLAMGTILGGTVAPGADGARVIYQGTAGKLDGVTMDDNMIIGDVNNTYVNLFNGLTLNGTAYVGWGSNFGRLVFNGPQTMDGTGEVVFSDNGSNSIYAQSGPVTIGPGILVHGFRGRLQGSVGFVNQGVIRSDESGGLISLEGTGWRNEGVIEAVQDGTLNLVGLVTTADLGDWRGAEGVVALDGILDNTGDVLTLDAVTGSLVLAMGTILGGTVAPGADGARVIYQGTAGKLNGVVMDDDMTLGAVDNCYVTILSGMTLNGTAAIGWGSNFGRLVISGVQTLDGTGEIVFGDSGSNTIYAASGTLTIGPDLMIRGVQGRFQGSSDFVNLGSIQSVEPGGIITLEGTSWTNQGSLMAEGATLTCRTPVTNHAQVTVGRGGLLDTEEDLVQISGTTMVDSAGVLHSDLTVDIQGGVLKGYGTTEGVLANAGFVGPGYSAGILSHDGDFSQVEAGALNIELGGTEYGLHDKFLVSGNVNLDGILSVGWIYNFSPAAGDSFVVMEFAGRTGTFAVEEFPALPPGLNMIAEYSPNEVILRVVGSELFASIQAISDVPDDEGGLVEISWAASTLDDAGEPDPVTSYEVQKFGSSWEEVGAVSATGDPSYSAVIPTPDILVLGESPPWGYYRILTHTDSPGVFYSSPSDSGYSIDNLPPPPPVLVLTEDPESRVLSWSNPGVLDVDFTCLYRIDSLGAMPDSLMTCTADISWTESHQFFYNYYCYATDIHGNTGASSNIVEHVYPSSAMAALPSVPVLTQNYPNPFNPGTVIRFELPRRMHASLAIYGVDGKLVAYLGSGMMERGVHEFAWRGRDHGGRLVGAGVYFFRLDAGDFSETKRMALVR